MRNIPNNTNKTLHFISLLKEKYECFRNKEYEILENYVNAKTKILIKSPYGLCKVTPTQILSGYFCSAVTAIDKNSYYINRAREVHGYRYDYSKVKYITAKTKIEIICKKHGSFLQTPDKHLGNRNCPKCRTNKAFIRAVDVSIGWRVETWIKRSKTSPNFKGFRIYVIECWNDEEIFYKIGRTFTTVQKRFKSNFPYKWELVYQHLSSDPMKIYNKEIKIKKLNKHIQYVPNKKFGGRYECYKTKPIW